MSKSLPFFLHLDMDAFFSSVEQLDHPEWRGKPVIVGSLPGEVRGVVATASYEARTYGVHSAMPTFRAYKLCPNGIYVHPRMERYSELSDKIMSLLAEYSPDVRQRSIDEACIDLTGTELLFGPPEETALKIQKEILLKTGLTVSLGLAGTRYLSKLASEVKKPAGFFYIKHGTEQDFMLSLPLKKVWGVGEKTLERLNRAGIYTTKDIYEKDLDVLRIMFGESTASFLYNTVRGLEPEEPKEQSHSISNETTFPTDVHDLYTAETALLALCQNVMFRLHKEKGASRTVMVKLRYDDFTTVSIRETTEEPITNVDLFFEKAKALFRKKHIRGRSIRLLGVGLENILDEKSVSQEVLFDFGSKKKAAVENAILKLNEKHPEAKIQKARILDKTVKTLLAIFLMTVLCSRTGVFSEEYVPKSTQNAAGTLEAEGELIPLPKESEKSLFKFDIKDNAVEFIAQGWWQGELSGSATITDSKKEGTVLSTVTPVFTQQVDLTMQLFLNRQWYFEAAFADEFERNTIAAGFYGKETNPLKEVRIANRGIFFPDGYSSDLLGRSIGGGQNQAPGIMAHFEDPVRQKWQADAAFRYQMQETHDATFYGKNSVSKSITELSSYIKNQIFVLPQGFEIAQKISGVYVLSKSGTYKDKNSRKFRKLSADEYIALNEKQQLVISKDAFAKDSASITKKCAIAIEVKNLTESELLLLCGSFDDPQTFLGAIQEAFTNAVNLKKYCIPLTGTIDGKTVLFLQEESGFSPFESAQFYDIGYAESAKISIEHRSTEKDSVDFFAEETDELLSFMESAFLNEQHTFVKVYSENLEDGTSSKAKSALIRYPFARTAPEVYLGYKATGNTDLVLSSKKYTRVSEYSIGTNINSGSVKVYKNGILLSGTTYDADSGTVHIPQAVSDYDKIYITWSEDSESRSSGAIAFQTGFSYAFTPELSADLTMALDWTVSPYTDFSEDERTAPGSATISTGLFYSNKGISLSNAFGFTAETPDVTGIYKVCTFDGAQNETYYLKSQSALYPDSDFYTVVALSTTSTESNIFLSESQNRSPQNSPSAKKDSLISGYKVPLEWHFYTDETGERQWASMEVKLAGISTLKNAESLVLAIQDEKDLLESGEVDFYIQLGINAAEDKDAEYSERIPAWHITSFETAKLSAAQKEAGWKNAVVKITEEQQSLFTEYKDARIIISATNINAKNKSGLIYVGPYQVIQKSIAILADQKMNARALQELDNSAPAKKSSEDDENYIQKITWQNDNEPAYDESETITLGTYFSEADFSRYKKLCFLVKGLSASAVKIQLDKDALNLTDDGTVAIKTELSSEALFAMESDTESWHIFAVDFSERRIFIDGVEVTGNSRVKVNDTIIPSRLKIEFIPKQKSGSFSFDELTFEESSVQFVLQDTAEFLAKKEKALILPNGNALVKNAEFKSRNTVVSAFSEDGEQNTTNYTGTAGAKASFGPVFLQADAEFESSKKNAVTAAGHRISTERPILKIFDFSDIFTYRRAQEEKDRDLGTSLDFSAINIPVFISAQAKSAESGNTRQTSFDGQIRTRITTKSFSFFADGSAKTSQKIRRIEEDSYNEDYALAYAKSTKEAFSAGSKDAYTRLTSAKGSLGVGILKLLIEPRIFFETEQKYSSLIEKKYSDTSAIKAELPIKLKSQSINLSYKKTGGAVLPNANGTDYSDDIRELTESLKNREWFFKSVIFYDLFASELLTESDAKNIKADSAKYSGLYDFSWKRNSFLGQKDFFIPSALTISTERQITAADSVSDVYIVKANIMNTALNLFGRQSATPLFLWYDSDDFSCSLIGNARIPAESPKDTTYSVSLYAQGNIFITEGKSIKEAFQFTLETDGAWSARNTTAFKRNTKKSPIVSAAALFYKKKPIEPKLLTRQDSLDIYLRKNERLSTYSNEFTYTHSLNAKLNDFITLKTSGDASLKFTEKVTSFILSGTLGGTVSF